MDLYKNEIMNIISEKITEVCKNTENIYFAGRNDGYDLIWRVKQVDSTPKTMTANFGGRWTVETFRPIYDMVPTSAQYMFFANTLNIDLAAHLESLGIRLDFSQCTNQTSCFTNSLFTRLGNVSALGGYNYVFSGCTKLVTIDEWGDAQGREMSDSGLTTTFTSCLALENIRIKGKFANSVYFHWSKNLTRESIESIVEALSPNASGKTLQLSKSAVNAAFSTEWDIYIRSKKPGGWTVTLI